MEETIKRQRALTLVKRMETPGWFKIAVPVASIIGGFLFSAIFLMAAGESPIKVYSVMFGGAFGSLYGLGETVVKMIPLMIVSVGVSFAFKMQIWNAGGEGQLHIGAAAATYVVLHLQGYDKKTTLTAAFLAAFICAGLYGLMEGERADHLPDVKLRGHPVHFLADPGALEGSYGLRLPAHGKIPQSRGDAHLFRHAHPRRGGDRRGHCADSLVHSGQDQVGI